MVLSFFSAQSLAGSCPDGSEPVKSISDDGTYFVYNCGGVTKQSSSSTGSWNDPGPLDELTIPDNWQLFKYKETLIEARKSFKAATFDGFGLGERHDKNTCLEVVKDWGQSMIIYNSNIEQIQASTSFGGGEGESHDLQSCLDNFIYSTQNSTGTPDYMKEILLHWAKTDAVFIPNGIKDTNWGNYVYEAVQSWSSFGSYYGTFYDEFSYSDSDRKIVDSYIKNKLLNVNTRNMYQKDRQACDPNNLEKTINGQLNYTIDANTCGSSIWKITLAQLLVGLRLNDEALFKKGIENTKWQLSFFDDTGIFTTWALKGSSSYQYTSSIPIMLGGLTEIYASISYDFMEHKLRNGLSIKEVMDRQYEIFLDPHILDSYVKKYPTDYKGTPNAVYLNSSAEEIKNENKDNLFVFVRNLPRYIDTYRADIGNSQEFDKKLLYQPPGLWENVTTKSLGNFQPMDPYLVYISSIDDLCKDSPLNGEYIASWFAASTNDDVGWEFVGSEGLTIDCWKGSFEAAKDFQPEDWIKMSKALRKDLNVYISPDGTINISGNLDLDYSGTERISIKSDTQGGEISGYFNPGWLLKIEINSSKTKNNEISKVTTSDSDPTVSKVIEVIQGDKFIVDIAEPHELAGTNINLNLRDVDAPDAVKSCPKQLEFGNQVKDFVAQKIAGATSLKITNFRKTSKAIIGQVIIDGKDLGAMLIQNGYASDEYGYWKGYFCSALIAIQAGISNEINGDYEESIFWYERALIIDPEGSNNSQATFALSALYRMKGDTKKSLEYLKQSANLGYMQAEEALGEAYMSGVGVSKNQVEAKKWLKRAHDHGSKNAENICGCEF